MTTRCRGGSVQMATMPRGLEEQTRGYERYVAERWDVLEEWEREQFRSVKALVGDKRIRKHLTSTPDMASRRVGRTWADALRGPQSHERTVSLAYALMFAGILFFPIFL